MVYFLNNSSSLSLEFIDLMFFCRTMNVVASCLISSWIEGESLLPLLPSTSAFEVYVALSCTASAFSLSRVLCFRHKLPHCEYLCSSCLLHSLKRRLSCCSCLLKEKWILFAFCCFFVASPWWLLVVIVSFLLSNPFSRLLTVVATSFLTATSSWEFDLLRRHLRICCIWAFQWHLFSQWVDRLWWCFSSRKLICITMQCNSFDFVNDTLDESLSFFYRIFLLLPKPGIFDPSSIQFDFSHVCWSDAPVSYLHVLEFHKCVSNRDCRAVYCVLFCHSCRFNRIANDGFHFFFFAFCFESM